MPRVSKIPRPSLERAHKKLPRSIVVRQVNTLQDVVVNVGRPENPPNELTGIIGARHVCSEIASTHGHVHRVAITHISYSERKRHVRGHCDGRWTPPLARASWYRWADDSMQQTFRVGRRVQCWKAADAHVGRRERR